MVNHYKGYRVAIVGSCQVTGLGQWTRRLLPGSTVNFWHVGTSEGAMPNVITPQLVGCDLIVTQIGPGEQGGRLDVTALLELAPVVVFLPMFVFRGFHPDIVVRVSAQTKQFFKGPMGPFHSAIVAAAHRLQIPSKRVPQLFNALVFKSARYPDVFPKARAALLNNFGEHGFDLTVPFDSWMKDGAFMYTDNHPHLRVLETLTRLILETIGLTVAEEVEAPSDSLANSIQWPVYDDLARLLGVEGSMTFMRTNDDFNNEKTRQIEMQAFVDLCYDSYQNDEFLDDPQTEEMLSILKEIVVNS